MSDKPTTAAMQVGCLASIWSLVVTGPMWLVLIYMILSAIELPTPAWVLFWCYVPAHLFGIILCSLWKVVRGGEG